MALVFAFGYVAALFVVAGTLLWIMDRIRRNRQRKLFPPEKLEAMRQEYERRLLNPNWEFYRQHLGRPVPEALKDLYERQALLLSAKPVNACEIQITQFEPIDPQGLLDTKEWVKGDAVAFASAEGDPIYLRPGSAEPNAVYITYHDGGTTERLSQDIAEFVADISRQTAA